MSRGMGRAERLRQMELLYLERAYTDKEMAEALGVRRETAYEDRVLLEGQIPFIEVEYGRRKIDRTQYLPNIRVNLHEALALYLAVRRESRHARAGQTHVVRALEKLALALKQPMTERLVRVAGQMGQAPVDRARVKVMEDLAQGWALRQKVRVHYRAMHAEDEKVHLISPYLIEPSNWSDAVYVIAQSNRLSRPVPFNVARIEQSFVTTETFELPEDFDEQELLRYAWGIWSGEREPTRVRLKFTGHDAIKRLRESVWHPLQKPLVETGDGSVVWEAPVAEWREMLPWVRGWGAEVEVLEPEGLREQVIQQVMRMVRHYGLASDKAHITRERVLRLWGKTGTTEVEFHPAVFHMLDVGHVAQALLSQEGAHRWKAVLSRALELKQGTLEQWLPFAVAVHDIGKISAVFQNLNAGQAERLKREGFPLDVPVLGAPVRHSTISQIHFETDQWPELDQCGSLTQLVGEVLGGHHGQYAHSEMLRTARDYVARESSEWGELRRNAESMLRRTLISDAQIALPSELDISAGALALTGFAILCDWLGSDARYFEPRPEMDWNDYVEHSRARALSAVEDSGLLAPSTSAAPCKVEDLFADLSELRPLQRAVDEIPAELLREPTLTIIEAPTGEGKTEAALALAHRIARETGTDEMYYALPTMATSNQMFQRLEAHLDSRLGLDARVKLVHGQAALVEPDLRAKRDVSEIEPLAQAGRGEEATSRESVEWFNGNKRALLAPFGVGTIDQAELASLNVKHAALRLMGLAGKVVIVDEVHAYDTYMTTIIERLLKWLSTMQTSVVLLSATLPLARRQKLIEAFGGTALENDPDARAYPSMLVTGRERTYSAHPAVWQPDRVLHLRSLALDDSQPQAKAEWLIEQVRRGGVVCWITNTVGRAQKTFAALRELHPEGIELHLLHSQFPLEERQAREAALNARYGPARRRAESERGIVVGTQVLEQSLDLDFDAMVSDLAPVDLLLQRAGRLHRHMRARPPAHAVPRFWINAPVRADGRLALGSDRKVYAEYLVRQTARVLTGRDVIELPADYRNLIEAVYGGTAPADDDELADAWQKLRDEQDLAQSKARERLLPAPDPLESFASVAGNRLQFLEDENGAGFIVAQTRLGEKTLEVIPLEREGDLVKLDGMTLDVHSEPPRDAQRQLLRRALRISQREAVALLEKEGDDRRTELFQAPLLKRHYPIWLQDGQARYPLARGELVIRLDANLGLVMVKEDKTHEDDGRSGSAL